MADWATFEAAEPDMAAAVAARFGSARHHVLATIRADGSPRVSGTEVEITGGQLRFGSMWMARKAQDLRRDPRLALHAHTGDGSMAGGDAKLSGRAVEEMLEEPAEEPRRAAQRSHTFVVDITEVVLTTLHPAGDRLVVQRWRPVDGLRTWERA